MKAVYWKCDYCGNGMDWSEGACRTCGASRPMKAYIFPPNVIELTEQEKRAIEELKRNMKETKYIEVVRGGETVHVADSMSDGEFTALLIKYCIMSLLQAFAFCFLITALYNGWVLGLFLYLMKTLFNLWR